MIASYGLPLCIHSPAHCIAFSAILLASQMIIENMPTEFFLDEKTLGQFECSRSHILCNLFYIFNASKKLCPTKHKLLLQTDICFQILDFYIQISEEAPLVLFLDLLTKIENLLLDELGSQRINTVDEVESAEIKANESAMENLKIETSNHPPRQTVNGASTVTPKSLKKIALIADSKPAQSDNYTPAKKVPTPIGKSFLISCSDPVQSDDVDSGFGKRKSTRSNASSTVTLSPIKMPVIISSPDPVQRVISKTTKRVSKRINQVKIVQSENDM